MERPTTIYASTLTRRGLARRRARLRRGPRLAWVANVAIVALGAAVAEKLLS